MKSSRQGQGGALNEPLEQVGSAEVSVTLEAENAQTLREFMKAEDHRNPGTAAGQLLRLGLAAVRREGGSRKYVDKRIREAMQYEAAAPGRLASVPRPNAAGLAAGSSFTTSGGPRRAT